MTTTNEEIEVCARLAHEINRAYCRSLGDRSQSSWDDAPDWQKESARAGAKAKLENPDITPEQSHEGWLAQKEADGWKYGPVKDVEKKEHPCFVPYDELPPEQKCKDYLFTASVEQGRNLLGICTNLALAFVRSGPLMGTSETDSGALKESSEWDGDCG